MEATASTIRELTAHETALVGGGEFTWGGFFAHVSAGAIAGGLAGAAAGAGVGAGPGALGGALLGGIEYSVSEYIESYF